LSAISTPLHSSDLLAMSHQAWTAEAIDDVLV
jgi:hypothetical protein